MLTRRKKLQCFYRHNLKAKKDNRIPPWFIEEFNLIRNFYLELPDNHTVDHIVPLRGKNVSGLHTLANLQYLTLEENIKKRNYFEDFQPWTKEYEAMYMKEYAKKNAEHLSQYRKAYREVPENKQKAKEYAKAYYQKNKMYYNS